MEFKLKTIKIEPTSKILGDRGLDDGGRVQQYIDNEVLKQCEPYTPMDSGQLIASGRVSGSGEITYGAPYARRWYYQPARFQGAPKRGNYWFERMKAEGGKQKILNGAAKISGGHI